MHKLLLISILVADVAIPIWASRHRDARRGLKRALLGLLVFNVFYLGAVLVTWH